MVGQTRGYWCATTSNFDVDGLWSWCTGPGTNSYLACVFPYLYKGVLRSTCVLDINGDSWCAYTADYDRDSKGIYCLDGVISVAVLGTETTFTTAMTVPAKTSIFSTMTSGPTTQNASAHTTISGETSVRTTLIGTSTSYASKSGPVSPTMSTTGAATAVPRTSTMTMLSSHMTSSVMASSVKMTSSSTQMTSSLTQMTSSLTQMASSPTQMTSALTQMASSRTQMTSSLKQMTSALTQMASSPAKMTSSSAQMTTSPVWMTTSTAHMTTSPAQMTTSLGQMTTSSTKMTISLGQMTTSPAQMTTSPAEDTTSAQMTTSPAEDTTSAQMTTSPAEDTTSAQMTTSPAEDTTSAQMTTSPAEDTTSAQMTTSPAEDTTSPAQMTTSPVPMTTTSTQSTTAVMSISQLQTLKTKRPHSSNSTNSTEWPQLMEWLQLANQSSSAVTGLGIIPELQIYTSSVGPSGLHVDEVALIVYILSNITESAVQSNWSFSISTFLDILNITDQLLNESSWTPVSSVDNTLGSQLLQSVETILEGVTMTNASFNVSYENIDFHCLAAPCSNLTNQTALKIVPHASFALDEDDLHQHFDSTCLVNIMLLSYRSLSRGFPSHYEQELVSGSVFQVESNILTNVMFLGNKTYHKPNVNLSFKCNSNECDQTAVCAFWNFSTNSWSSDGCTSEVIDGITNCFCNHLTSFSVLIAKFIPQALLRSAVLDYITVTGLSISIVSLILCMSFQVYVMRIPMNLVSYYRHLVILNVSVFLLLSNVSFIAAGYITPKDHLRLCAGLTFCTHFSLLAFFCWTLVQSGYLFCRLVFVFHHITKKEFMTLSVGLGYVCPTIIAVGTFIYYTPTNDYNKDNVCWLNSSSGASMAFIVPTIITISTNFLVLLVVIRKLLRRSISEGNTEDEEVIKKLVKAIVFCTPQFGLTWAVGIPLFSDGSVIALHYLFVLLNPLQVSNA
ncbi:adhesion G-protein coupled receptor F2-like isoform X2 [Hyperolius riggenbachi]|uniref:adhesion G-protein coupled receptor F2-like isoform X2 n=1 Tax=Hyperolius riggenbachi TaxID=752182 RepID=UPI0035A32975